MAGEVARGRHEEWLGKFGGGAREESGGKVADPAAIRRESSRRGYRSLPCPTYTKLDHQTALLSLTKQKKNFWRGLVGKRGRTELLSGGRG